MQNRTYTHKNIEFEWGGKLSIYINKNFIPINPQLNNGILSWRLNRKIWLSINQLKKYIKNE